jgi:hypothetical protein
MIVIDMDSPEPLKRGPEDESTKTRTLDDFKWEVVIHEAGHFVFNQLIDRMDLGFKPLSSAKAQFTKDNNGRLIVDACVSGLGAPYKPEEWTHFSTFYQEKPARLIATMLSIAAGYATYPHFIEIGNVIRVGQTKKKTKNGEWVSAIHFTPESDDEIIVPYWSTRKTSKHVPGDTAKLEELYVDRFIRTEDEQKARTSTAFYALAQEAIQDNEEIQKAILHVARKLLEANNGVIEGQPLDSLINEVGELLNGVSLDPYIRKGHEKWKEIFGTESPRL